MRLFDSFQAVWIVIVYAQEIRMISHFSNFSNVSWFRPKNHCICNLVVYNINDVELVGISNKTEKMRSIIACFFLTSKLWDNASWEWIWNLFLASPELPWLWLNNPESLQKQQMLDSWWSDPQSPIKRKTAFIHLESHKNRVGLLPQRFQILKEQQ